MPSNNIDLNQTLYRLLAEPHDIRLEKLAEGVPDALSMARLLATYPEISADVNVRYLAPGRSGAKVILLTHPIKLPVVVKFGTKDDIAKEVSNYHSSHVQDTIPPEIVPGIKFTKTTDDYGLIVYSWAGGWEQVSSLYDFFHEANAEELIGLVDYLMPKLFRWHTPHRSSDLPFDQWKWDTQTLNAITDKIGLWPRDQVDRQKIITAMTNPYVWRDALRTKHSAQAVCHGDLNCHNVLVARLRYDCIPKLIDFASVSFNSSPARDWAKLEREIKLRCLRELLPEPEKYAAALEEVDKICNSGGEFESSDTSITKAARMIATIRERYSRQMENISDIPSIEYLYFLFCWTLAYLNNHDGQHETPPVQNAIIDSAFRTLELLDSEIKSPPKSRPRPVSFTHEPDELLVSLGSRFVSQLRIAGHLEGIAGSQNAIYLDDDLYVHRELEESVIMAHVNDFAEGPAHEGKWISITGKAGHGKSSLLWYLYKSLNVDDRLSVVPFLAQTENSLAKIEETVLGLRRELAPKHKLVVLVDTVDILVGVDDAALTATLNSLRASGCLLITTSRNSEAERLSKVIASDHRVELKRYNDNEAQKAIKKYINLAYPEWDKTAKDWQFEKLWGLLEQQRQARELDLEPLILRMIFEAYVPDEIPQDVNTQQVYKKYWKERVLSDRVVKNAEEKFKRERICCFIARQIVFNNIHTDKLSLGSLSSWWKEEQSEDVPLNLVEGLISSGALQWEEGSSSVRFFHQTFLEYAAAYDLLSSDGPVVEARVRMLLDDVRRFDLFRTPVLKQLIVQAFDADHTGEEMAQGLIKRVRGVNNELSAQIALEIVGKIRNTDFSKTLCRQWIEQDPSKLQGVICETVRYYPKSKTGIALYLLEPYLNSSKEKAIYSLCKDMFAKGAADEVYQFLHRKLADIKHGTDDVQKDYKEALCTVLQQGTLIALEDLRELFPHLKSGQQAGLLYSIAEVITEANANAVVLFLKDVFQHLLQISRKKQAEVWAALLNAIASVHEVSPATTRELVQWLIETERWKQDDTSANYVGRILGLTLTNRDEIQRALSNVASVDHLVRLMSSGILSQAPKNFSTYIMESILALDVNLYQEVDCVRSLFSIVASLTNVASEEIFKFLERWSWPESGIGNPLRQIIQLVAERDPTATKDWLLKKLHVGTESDRQKIFTALSIMLQVNATSFRRDEVESVYQAVRGSSKHSKQVLAGAIGCVAKVDKAVAGEIFSWFFAHEGKDCQVTAVTSLAYCLESCPEFALEQGATIIKVASATGNRGLLDSYLVSLKSYPRAHAGELLRHLNEWFTPELFQKLRDEKILGELLTLIKVATRAEPRVAFDLSKRVPLISKGIAGGLAAIYDQISEHSSDAGLLSEVLDGVCMISKFNQVRIGNALRRALPRLDEKLGDGKVIRAVLSTYKEIADEQSLLTFMRAVLAVPSWTEEETQILLQDNNLPSSIRGLISANRNIK